MATTIGENTQPAVRPAGRRSNPLVANVFPPAFAIQNHAASGATNRCKTYFSHPALAEPGFEPGSPGFRRALLPCSPAGIRAAAKETGDKTAGRDMAASSLGDLRQARMVATGGWPVFFGANVCSLAGIRRFQKLSQRSIRSPTSGPTSCLPRLYSFNVVPSGIRPAKNSLPGRAGACVNSRSRSPALHVYNFTCSITPTQ